jgi:hypothetical protein
MQFFKKKLKDILNVPFNQAETLKHETSLLFTYYIPYSNLKELIHLCVIKQNVDTPNNKRLQKEA